MKIAGRLVVMAVVALCVSEADAQVALETKDGLRIELSTRGRVKAVSVDRGDCRNAEGASGFQIVDAATDECVEVAGRVERTDRGARQEATLEKLGLAFEANYLVHDDHIKILGAVRDLRGKDRAVDVLYRLPVGGERWHTWVDLTTRRTLVVPAAELPARGRRLELWVLGFEIDAKEGFVALGSTEEAQRPIGPFGAEEGNETHRAFVVRGIARSDLREGRLTVRLENPTGAGIWFGVLGLLLRAESKVSDERATERLMSDLKGELQTSLATWRSTGIDDGPPHGWGSGLSIGDGQAAIVELQVGRHAQGPEAVKGLREDSDIYPWKVLVREKPPVAVTLAVPADKPCIFDLYFDPDLRALVLKQSYGLSPDAAGPLKSRASFALVIYRSDPAWGFRAAAKKYYDLYPRMFERRAMADGCWLYGAEPTRRVPNPKDFKYHECPSYEIDEELGIGSYPYRIPGQRSISRLQKLPKSYQEAMAAFEAYQYQPGNSYGGPRVKDEIANCRMLKANGEYAITIREYFGKKMVTFPVNTDPSLFEDKELWTVAKFEKEWLEKALAEHPEMDGVYLDAPPAWCTKHLDHRRDHFPYADIPLTYDPVDKSPAIHGRFAALELLARLRERLWPEGKTVFPNMGPRIKHTYHYFYSDIAGIESVRPTVSHLNFHRTAAYQKPVLLLPYKLLPNEHLWRLATLYGIFAGGAKTQRIVKDYETLKPLYERYMPVVRRLSAAGWEPVTAARVEADDLLMERFGPKNGELLLTIYNRAEENITARVRIERQRLGIRSLAAVEELFTGQCPAPREPIEIVVPAKELRVLALRLQQ